MFYFPNRKFDVRISGKYIPNVGLGFNVPVANRVRKDISNCHAMDHVGLWSVLVYLSIGFTICKFIVLIIFFVYFLCITFSFSTAKFYFTISRSRPMTETQSTTAYPVQDFLGLILSLVRAFLRVNSFI